MHCTTLFLINSNFLPARVAANNNINKAFLCFRLVNDVWFTLVGLETIPSTEAISSNAAYCCNKHNEFKQQRTTPSVRRGKIVLFYDYLRMTIMKYSKYLRIFPEYSAFTTKLDVLAKVSTFWAITDTANQELYHLISPVLFHDNLFR